MTTACTYKGDGKKISKHMEYPSTNEEGKNKRSIKSLKHGDFKLARFSRFRSHAAAQEDRPLNAKSLQQGQQTLDKGGHICNNTSTKAQTLE